MLRCWVNSLITKQFQCKKRSFKNVTLYKVATTCLPLSRALPIMSSVDTRCMSVGKQRACLSTRGGPRGRRERHLVGAAWGFPPVLSAVRQTLSKQSLAEGWHAGCPGTGDRVITVLLFLTTGNSDSSLPPCRAPCIELQMLEPICLLQPPCEAGSFSQMRKLRHRGVQVTCPGLRS